MVKYINKKGSIELPFYSKILYIKQMLSFPEFWLSYQ